MDLISLFDELFEDWLENEDRITITIQVSV
jgi:hypothetical protein